MTIKKIVIRINPLFYQILNLLIKRISVEKSSEYMVGINGTRNHSKNSNPIENYLGSMNKLCVKECGAFHFPNEKT